MNFDSLNWQILDRLRATFLEGKPARRAYWTSSEDLAQYDLTFGARIGWKWDAVLDEMKFLGWSPPDGTGHVIDWGCGSGVAGRRVLAAFPSLRCLTVFDHSPHAVTFSARSAGAAFPGVKVQVAATAPSPEGSLVVLSHVANELAPRAEEQLLEYLGSAAAILWVEPGTHQVGRRLQSIRNRLSTRFDVVAPCTHQGACPLLASGREADWCHQFAAPPPEVFTDGNWVRFARRAGIDLRGLPYSYLALQARPPGKVPQPSRSWARVLAKARVGKADVWIQACSQAGITDFSIRKNAAPELFHRLRHQPAAAQGLCHPQDPRCNLPMLRFSTHRPAAP